MFRTTRFSFALICSAISIFIFGVIAAPNVSADWVAETPGELPVVGEYDVVIIGSGTGAVAAAVEAADLGASVFLASPYPYLGEDMTATLRMMRDPNTKIEDPLAALIFNDSPGSFESIPKLNAPLLKFKYESSIPSSPVHADTKVPSKLTDGRRQDPSSQSVQYDGDVTISVELPKATNVDLVRAIVFHRSNESDSSRNFIVKSMSVSTSSDGTTWSEPVVVKTDTKKVATDSAFTIAAPIDEKVKYLRLTFAKGENCTRILLGEIEIYGNSDTPIAVETNEPTEEEIFPPRPMHVKKVLDQALLDAGVKFLYSCHTTGLVRDASGKPCGVILNNRAGRQVVLGRTIIDTTCSSAGFGIPTRRADNRSTMIYMVVGGVQVPIDCGTSKIVGRYVAKGNAYPLIEYTFDLEKLEQKHGAIKSVDQLEQLVRTATYDPNQQFTADEMVFDRQVNIVGSQPDNVKISADAVTLECFQPKGMTNYWVMGELSDVSNSARDAVIRNPIRMIAEGRKVAKAAVKVAKTTKIERPISVASDEKTSGDSIGTAREIRSGLRVTDTPKETVKIADGASVPIIDRCDVLIIGGGTAGAPAGIAAARLGAKTIMCERLHMLGGVATSGLISKYYHGNRVGFSGQLPGTNGAASWNIEPRAEYFRREFVDAGGQLMYGTLGCGMVVDESGKKSIGAVISRPGLRGVILAHVVIDATGGADMAAAAGLPCMYTGSEELALQGTGLPPRNLGTSYTNTDWTISDETDMIDTWRMFVVGKYKYPNAFDQGKLIDTRERRRVVGDVILTVMDQIGGRTFPDTICEARGGTFDTHGYTVHEYFQLHHPSTTHQMVNIPYRAILPRDFDGMMVVGLGTSAHRDAIPLIRMQPDLHNQGYAAGAAAALASKENMPTRGIDMKRLQEYLVKVENLRPQVLEYKDNFPLTTAQIADSVEKVGTDLSAAWGLMTDVKRAIPMLRDQYDRVAVQSSDEARVKTYNYAYTLAALGDPTGLPVLIEKIKNTEEWDKGWNYRGMGQFGPAMSKLDYLIVVTARPGDASALPAILEKMEKLDASYDFSHFRAIALALEAIGEDSDEVRGALVRLLDKPGITGHAQHDIATAVDYTEGGNTNSEQSRRLSLRELFLARALYRLGDQDGRGRAILEEYVRDIRGHYSRHAAAALEEK